jgi:hypothetical protein
MMSETAMAVEVEPTLEAEIRKAQMEDVTPAFYKNKIFAKLEVH